MIKYIKNNTIINNKYLLLFFSLKQTLIYITLVLLKFLY